MAGVSLLGVLIAGVIWWPKKEPSETRSVAVSPPPSATIETVLEHAPPPPPDEEEEDDEEAPVAPTKGARKGPLSTPCADCGMGIPGAALRSAVSGSASLAHGCYNRALRTGGAQGSLTVSVHIGSHGGVCGAAVSNDTLGNPGISQCVLSKFRGRSYPKPEKGCVVVNVPLAFKMK
jgi:hypothetical protein